MSALAARADPETSHEAAARIVASGKHERQVDLCLRGVEMWPGCTSGELAVKLQVDRYTTARRLPDLRRRGLVHTGEARECTALHTKQMTWWPGAQDTGQGEMFA